MDAAPLRGIIQYSVQSAENHVPEQMPTVTPTFGIFNGDESLGKRDHVEFNGGS
jgi:hypothetical protein